MFQGAQAEVLKLKEIKSGEFFAGKFYFSKDPELIQQVFLYLTEIRKNIILIKKKDST